MVKLGDPVESQGPAGDWELERSSSNGTVTLRLGGSWTLSARIVDIAQLEEALQRLRKADTLMVRASGIGSWDSRLVAALLRIRRLARERRMRVRLDGLPEGVSALLDLAEQRTVGKTTPQPSPADLLSRVGAAVLGALQRFDELLAFLGALAVAMLRLVAGRAILELRDFLLFLQRSGADALPIVSLIAFLVGIILAFVGTTQLAQIGAQIYVANLVTLGMAREMGALMAAIIMAGRTGAAFAAELASMRVGEELDAFETLGLPPIEYLVLPRMLALALMMPLLALYADMVGMVGGALSTIMISDVSLAQYYEQSLLFLDLVDFLAGLGKAALFGWLVGFAGCFTGLHCERTAAGVGRATTRAVVFAIVLIVLGDALMTVVYYVLDI